MSTTSLYPLSLLAALPIYRLELVELDVGVDRLLLRLGRGGGGARLGRLALAVEAHEQRAGAERRAFGQRDVDRKSTRLNSSHQIISYAVFCLKKKMKTLGW